MLERALRGLRRVGDRRTRRHGSHRSRAVAIAAALGVLAVPTLVLGSGAPSSAKADDTTFTVAFQREVDSFNPFLGIEAPSYEMWGLMYDYLTSYAMTDMSPRPGLAESWETSDDGLTWTFHVRTGVTWSDGKPLTAADVAYTYDRVLHGSIEGASWASYLENVDTVTAPDDQTVVLSLKKPNAVLPLLPIPIIPEHIWKNVTGKAIKTYANEPKKGQPVVGSGPFRLVSGTAGGSSYTFERNPDYWGGVPHIKNLVFRVYKSEDPAVQALVKGEVDFVEDISAIQVNSLQGREGITAHNGDSPGFDELAFNTGSVDTDTGKPIGDPNPAVLDPKFRYALGFALDRELLIKKVYQGAGLPGVTIIPPAFKEWAWEPPADLAYSYDPKRAEQLLDDAGYQVGADGLRTLPNGKPIGTIRLAARSDSPSSLDTMKYTQEWLKNIGIASKVVPYESSKLTDVILQGNFDIFQWGWYVEPDPNSMLSYLTCGQRGGWSDSWLCDEEYDKLYAAQGVEMDHAKRVEIVKQMQEILFTQAPYLITAYNTIGEAVRSDRWSCFVPQPDPGGIWLVQYGTYNYVHARPTSDGECDPAPDGAQIEVLPKAAAAGVKSSAGSGSLSFVSGLLGFVAGCALIGAFWAVDRRRTMDWRE